MISTLTGTVVAISSDSIVLMVGGVGFEVRVSPRFLIDARLQSEMTIFTRLIVREDEMSLYGFSKQTEREHFDLLLGVSGVGPKLAMTVLSGLDPEGFSRAISNQDEQAFRNISGVGPKTAKLILLTLTGKVSQEIPETGSRVLAALRQLGVDEASARRVLSEVDSNLSESQMLKESLKKLGKGK